MAAIKLSLPPLHFVGPTKAVEGEDSVCVEFGTLDRKVITLGFAASIVPALILRLGIRMKEMRDAGRGPMSAEVTATSIQLAMKADGALALVATMEDYQLVMGMSLEALKALHDDIEQMLKPN